MISDKDCATIAILALEQLRATAGIEMINAKFAQYTPAQMQEPHGNTGRTRAQIRAKLEQRDADLCAAIAWAKRQVRK